MKKSSDFYKIYEVKKKKNAKTIILNMIFLITLIVLMINEFHAYQLFLLLAFALCINNALRNKINLERACQLKFKTEYLEPDEIEEESPAIETKDEGTLLDDDMVGIIDED